MRIACVLLAALVTAPAAEATVPPETPLAAKVYRHPDLDFRQALQDASDLPPALAAAVARDAAALGVRPDLAFFDPRAGRLASLIASQPLLPGAGNDLAWPGGTPPADDAALGATAWAAVERWLREHHSVLRVDAGELATPRIGVFEGGTLVQAWSQRVIGGVPVRGSGLTAVVRHGNLVLLGLESWGDAAPSAAVISDADARAVVVDHVAPHVVEGFRAGERLEYVPTARGERYGHRLAWVVPAAVRGDGGSWEGLVDAATGELLAFEDTNAYARHVVGGVYPFSNDQRPPDGVEQAGWPMPLVNLATASGPVTTNDSGAFGCVAGPVSTALTGAATRINESCGAIDETSASGDLDLGFGPPPPAIDCAVPPGHSAGDTKAARTAFRELTRINQQARGYLPGNAWLATPLTANVNVNSTCGALWNGTAVTFYRDNNNGSCRNTGEIAGVLDHEWGHGLDDNGVNGTLSSPFEGIADVHAFLRHAHSCVGRGTFKNMVCGGYGDPCVGNPTTGCTGVRDIDFAGHVCGRPHTITWVLSGFPAGHCVDGVARPACPNGSAGPCGRLTHCEGHLVSETAFDLARRDLPAAGLDAVTAHELTTRLFMLGSQAVGSWYTCAVGGGCAASGGYLQLLAADDDDGNLANGTPHMTAIRAAFQRHEIHCATPAPVDSGCAGGPTAAPALSVTPGPERNDLSWTAVANAAGYAVYRSDGLAGCGAGRIKIAQTAGTALADLDLLGGHSYSYVVLPVGTNTACFGRASNCASGTPAADPCPATADFTLSCAPSSLAANPGGSATSTCTVQSTAGFSAAVTLSCTGLPAGVTCAYNPPSVTPAPNGAAVSTLTVTVGGAVPPGAYPFQAQGTSGALTHGFAMSLTVAAIAVVPQALAADAGGNGVLEPNELAVLAPTWRNSGQGAVALTGATSNFIGPAGAGYTNPDASAAYGTIPANAQATCTDCYAVNVIASTRPVTHWDATIRETVTGGTVKDWTLHLGGSFDDVPPSSAFHRFVETILHRYVTSGCGAAAYCPAASTTREQIAVFVLASKEPPGYQPPACGATPMFADVPASSPFCRWVEELARRGVVTGCGAGLYCPTAAATREAMAVFVLRTLDPALVPAACVAGAEMFADVPASSPFCRWIEELARRGVVTGCGGGNYCPGADVTREQMSVFLAVTFGLVLYGP